MIGERCRRGCVTCNCSKITSHPQPITALRSANVAEPFVVPNETVRILEVDSVNAGWPGSDTELSMHLCRLPLLNEKLPASRLAHRIFFPTSLARMNSDAACIPAPITFQPVSCAQKVLSVALSPGGRFMAAIAPPKTKNNTVTAVAIQNLRASPIWTGKEASDPKTPGAAAREK